MPTWTATGNGTWTDSANWSGGVPSGVGAEANFSFAANGGTALIGIPDFSIITLGTLNVTLTGTSNMTLKGSLTDGGAGDGVLIFDGGGTSAQVVINNDAGTGHFEIAKVHGLVVQLASNTNFNVVNAGGVAILSAPISGTGKLFKTGDGTLFLNDTNSFTGGIALQGGTLVAIGDPALGTGQISLANNAAFRSAGTINNTFSTNGMFSGTEGSGQLIAAAATTMTLTGALNHVSQGTITFGSATDTGTIVATFVSIGQNATNSSYRVGGGTVRFGDAHNAANLFNRPGTGLTEFTNGGILDTNGFATTISNLDFDDGTIRSSAGPLNVTVNDSSGVLNAQTGTLEGTGGADSFTVNATGGFSLAGLTLFNWTAVTDFITLNGSANANALTGSTGRDVIFGFDGADTLAGNGGVDSISGGNGNDTIVLIAANTGSIVDGGADIDTLRIGGAVSLGGVNNFEAIDLVGGATLTLTGPQFTAGFDLFSALNGNGTIAINMAAGGDAVNARGMSVAGGASILFSVVGNSGADSIKIALGATGNLSGGTGTDVIVGGDLVDTILGGGDIDKIRGGGGADILTGGTGADVFKYRAASDSGTGANADIITDFLSGTDRLNFSRIDTNAGLAGDQGFAFVGTGAFSGGGTASIRYTDLGADLRVEADVDGNGVADMHIILQGAGAQVLTAADFVL